MGAMASEQRVYLHVGLPKTGTSFVQAVLFEAREELRQAGVLYPAQRYDDHFFAALDLQELAFNGVPRPESAGRWEGLAAQVRAWPGTSLVSAEVLCAAAPDQVRRAVESLAPAEVHVVVTVRDLGSHLVATWQEDVKHGEAAAFADWYAAVSAHDESRWNLAWYWQSADLPSVLDRWGSALPSGHLHVVTVPPPGAARDTLWRRFARAVDLDPSTVDLSRAAWFNSGLGADSTALLRRLNATRSDRLDQVAYEHLVKGLLAHETLSRYPQPTRPGLPADLRALVEQRAQLWGDAVRTSGAEVIGDLTELLVTAPASTGPDDVADAAVLDVAVFATWELLLRVRDTDAAVAELADEVATLRAELGEALSTAPATAPSGPAKRLVRRASERSPAVMRARVSWWHAVERLRDR